jgi:hypothetical protein
MSTRGQQLAQQLEQAVQDFEKTVDTLSDDQWRATGPEGWSIAATAQHVSGQFPLEMEYVTAAAEGRPMPAYTWDDINGRNDSRAARNTKSSKADVLRELREQSGSVTAYLRGLSDEQLDRTCELPLAGNAQLSAQQVIESGVLIDHVRAHTKSLTATR